MKIEISTGEEERDWDDDVGLEHYGYFDSIDEAIQALQNLKKRDWVYVPRCDKCVYESSCLSTDYDGKCTQYKRDPPDRGYYG